MSYFTRYMDKCFRLHSFPVTRYIPFVRSSTVAVCAQHEGIGEAFRFTVDKFVANLLGKVLFPFLCNRRIPHPLISLSCISVSNQRGFGGRGEGKKKTCLGMEGVVTSFGFKDDSVSNLGKGNFFRKSLRVLNSLYFFPAKFVGNTNEFKESALSSPSWKKKLYLQ